MSAPKLPSVSLPREAIAELRWALLQGLHSMSEVRRVQGKFQELQKVRAGLEDGIYPSCLSCEERDFTRFVEALAYLEEAQPLEGER